MASRALLSAAVLLLVGCSPKKPVDSGTTDGGDVNAQGTLTLKVVGKALLAAHPQDKLTLSVVLVNQGVGPVAGHSIDFALLDGDNTYLLGPRSATTDSKGVATTVLVVGNVVQHPVVTVLASASEATGDCADNKSLCAAFAVNVTRTIRHLEVITTTGVTPDSSGQSATVAATSGGVATLKVREIYDSGGPVVNDSIVFAASATKPPDPNIGASVSGAAITDGNGEASLTIKVGQPAAAASYEVDATAEGGADNNAVFVVDVTQPVSGACTTTSQCHPGYVCSKGNCVSATTGGGCTGDNTCPVGYVCSSAHTCVPGSSGCGTCPTGTMCVAGMCKPPQCDTNDPCPSGFLCVDGACQPGSTPGDYIDLTGNWYTRHAFDIQDALPGFLKDKTTLVVIRTLDQVLTGRLNLPSWINSFLKNLVKQYIPDWVVKLISLLDDLFTILTTLRAEGTMDLTLINNTGHPATDYSLLNGTETWTNFVFYDLNQCPAGSNISCNPLMGYQGCTPACARVDIYTNQTYADGVTLAADPQPFTAKVAKGANGQWQILVDPREVKVDIEKLIVVLIDTLLQAFTPYQNIGDALANLIDCTAVNDFVNQYIMVDVTMICQGAVQLAAQEVTNWLAKIKFAVDTLDFSGHATAIADVAPNDHYGTMLGNDHFDADLHATRGGAQFNGRDGLWTGSFFIKTLSGMPGAWQAERDPWPASMDPNIP